MSKVPVEPGRVRPAELGCAHSGRILLGGRLKRRRTLWGCSHSSTITTITAGIAREVCESCSRVSVSYVEPAVRIHPDIETLRSRAVDRDAEAESTELEVLEPAPAELEEAKIFEAMVTFEKSSRLVACGVCSQPAVFEIPEGLRCNEHAWQAAALLDWADSDPWVPIRIDRSNA
jgi:hypothetical protein